MLAENGHILLLLALVIAIYAASAFFIGAHTKNKILVSSAQNAVFALLAMLTIAIFALQMAILQDDFRFAYVYGYSSRALPVFYKLSAVWAGQAGSLLFWGWLLAAYMALAAFIYRKKFTVLLPYSLGALSLVAIFFIGLVCFVESPFEYLPGVPPDGRGMNPLLQHPAMAIHPPILYLGYVGFAIPFAFAVGALLSGEVDNRWVKTVRLWTIVPWFFLGIGILLGGKWAYMELGWGGYWAWDPVENAAFMPWLTGTAFLHSIMIQEKKSMLKVWNVVLIFLTFALSIFGTFLTRSGIVASVHSFAQSQIGPLFLSFVVLIILSSALLLFTKRHLLHSENRIESIVSRESTFLINNVVFVGAAFAVFWGTVFPVLSKAVRGIEITVGPPWFNSVNIPIFLFLLFLTGVGPLVAWRKSSTQYLKRLFLQPLLLTIATAVGLILFGMTHAYAILSLSLCVFVTHTILAEFHRGARARRANSNEAYFVAIVNLIKKNQRRYGGYIIHFAIVLMFFGVTGAAFDEEVEINLKKDEAVEVGRYKVIYRDLVSSRDEHKEVYQAVLDLYIDDVFVETIIPQKHYYYVQ